MRLRDPTAPRIDDVDARKTRCREVRVRRVDARCRAARRSRPCRRDPRSRGRPTTDGSTPSTRRPAPDRRSEPGRRLTTSRSRSRSAADVGIQSRREPVDDARVAVLGRDPRPDRSQAGEELLLLRDGGGRPRAHLAPPSLDRRRRGRARRATAAGAGRRSAAPSRRPRALPSTPCQPASSTDCSGGSCARPPATPRASATTAVATATSQAGLRDGRVRIEVTVPRVWKRLDVPRR